MSFERFDKQFELAQKNGYAIGAFNADNMEIVKGIIRAAEELQKPVMIQTTTAMINYASASMYAAMVRAEAEKVAVPICLHLDHGASFELAMTCIGCGYQSVMFDGSALHYEENVRISHQIAKAAATAGVLCEAELGAIGGREDDMMDTSSGYTDPIQAKEFVERTGVSSLAVAIGTAHGFYEGTPVLDIDRLDAIRKNVSVPLVLHGASGLSEEQIRECVMHGIRKINFATDLRAAYTNAIKTSFQDYPEEVDPKRYGEIAIEAVAEVVKSKIMTISI